MPYDYIAKPCPNIPPLRWDEVDPNVPVPALRCKPDCELCYGIGYITVPNKTHEKVIEAFKEIGRTGARLNDSLLSLQDPMSDMADSLRYALQNMTPHQIEELMERYGRRPQDYPTEEDEVCCLCHEELRDAVEVPDLQGWAHRACAKEYFQ